MTGAPAIDAIIFDCDGVLVDSEVLAIRGERAALEAMGLPYSHDEYVRRFVGLHDGAFFSQLKDDHAARLGAAAPRDFVERVLDGRRREMPALTIIAGADAALIAAKERFGRIAVASSAGAAFLDSKLKRMGLFDFAAPHVYSADLVAAGKPAPDIFLYAAAKIGAAPARCLVLEDSVNGVKAGVAAGMMVWGFTGGGHCVDGYGKRLAAAGAHRVVAGHEAFLDAIA